MKYMRDAFKKWHGGSFFNPLVVLVTIVLVVIILTAPISKAALPMEVEWINQFGVSGGFALTYSQDVDITGNVYVGGGTTNALPGQTANGAIDAFVRKYDVNGIEQWTRQFGTSGNDIGSAIGILSSEVYVTGRTDGTFSGQTSSGNDDIFILKYDSSGNVVWTKIGRAHV